MPNAWIEHVRGFAKKNNLSYGCAMTDPKVKDGYVKKSKAVAVKKSKAPEETVSAFNARIKERWDNYTPKEQEEIRARNKAEAKAERQKKAEAKAERQKKAPVVKPIKKKLVVTSPARKLLSVADQSKLNRAKQQLSQMDQFASMGMMMDEDQRGEIEDTIKRLTFV